jgi:DNA-binding SARP family transcriptional activator/TolB-like protein
LPRSRKIRTLLSLLVLERRSLARSRLCDLLWDVPNDPRGELRWCLSKLRGLLDDADRRRVLTADQDLVALDLADCRVDALEIDGAAVAGIADLDLARLSQLADLFRGDLLEGVEVDGNPELGGWLAAQRQRYRALHVTVLRELAARAPRQGDETFRHLGAWLRLAPFDGHAHEMMFDALVARGRLREAEDHLAATIRVFDQEGLDGTTLRDACRLARKPTAMPAAPAIVTPAAPAEPRAHRRASIAIMPFLDGVSVGPAGLSGVADGLTEDVITRLAKLRAVVVIARGTAYALGQSGVGALEAGRSLATDYVASGSVRLRDGRRSVLIELAETRSARIIWAERMDLEAADTFAVIDDLVDRIVSAIAGEVEVEECHRAMQSPPASLDAWQAYHRGLWHMYRFTAADNLHAGRYFRDALALDSRFARAHAGLSFTHFQNAFLSLTSDRSRQMDLALETAGDSLGADDRDPAAHWAMGRALWLNGNDGESFGELQRTLDLSPNFALGHYTMGFVHSQSGDPRLAIDATRLSCRLSPFDPLQFAMFATRALAHVRLGEPEEAVSWALKAARCPTAHAHILAIAVECLSLANRHDEAQQLAARIRERAPSYNVSDLLRAFHFDRDTEALLHRSARRVGFDS